MLAKSFVYRHASQFAQMGDDSLDSPLFPLGFDAIVAEPSQFASVAHFHRAILADELSTGVAFRPGSGPFKVRGSGAELICNAAGFAHTFVPLTIAFRCSSFFQMSSSNIVASDSVSNVLTTR